MDLCDSEGDSCFGVMINPGWTQAFNGVRFCLSNVMADKGDWDTRMKEGKMFEHGTIFFAAVNESKNPLKTVKESKVFFHSKTRIPFDFLTFQIVLFKKLYSISSK